MKLVFATHNDNKLKEVKELLSNTFEIYSLNDIGFKNESNLLKNVIKKAIKFEVIEKS